MKKVFLLFVLISLFSFLNVTQASSAPRPPRPCNRDLICDFGPWNGVVLCESKGDLSALGTYGEQGLFQFLPSTRDNVARYYGWTRLIGADLRFVRPAVQLRLANGLRDMPGGGVWHWSCGGHYDTVHDPIKVCRFEYPFQGCI